MDFPFFEWPDTPAAVCRHALEEGAPILCVVRDEDSGMWHFLCRSECMTHEEDLRYTTLQAAWALDETVGSAWNLQPGFAMEREAVDAPWQTHRC